MPETRPSAAAEWARSRDIEAARSEVWLARVAVPAALVACLILDQTGPGRFLLRTFFGMWLHELGHAVVAWLCGFPAFPGPWVTSIAFSRSLLFALAITAGLGWTAWRGWQEQQRVLVVLAAAGLTLQLIGTLLLSVFTAQTLVTFGGDAGCLVLGAGAFAGTFGMWWTARYDYTVIPFGEIEGVGDSDPSKLNFAGWPIAVMVSRYVALGVIALIALFVRQFFYARRARQALESLERGPHVP